MGHYHIWNIWMRFLELAHLFRGWHIQLLYVTSLQCQRELCNSPQSGAMQKDTQQMRTPWGDQSKQVPIVSMYCMDIFISLLNTQDVNKRGRGLHSCLTAEAKAELCCPSSQSLGKKESVRHSPSPRHLIAKVTLPFQPIPAVKKLERKELWHPFCAPPAYLYEIFLPRLLAFSWSLDILIFLLWTGK